MSMTRKKFELKPEHLKLLQEMNVGWDGCEFGAPTIDPKRPYRTSDVYLSMLKLLGIKEIKEGVYEFMLFGRRWLLKGEDEHNIYLDGKDEEILIEALDKLHKETETALQVCLSALSFTPGTYVEVDLYTSKYELVKERKSGKHTGSA